MRRLALTLATLLLAATANSAMARNLNRHEMHMCKWGADVARHAQQEKLSGVTLYSARRKLAHQRFSQPWMRSMAMGITEQTYHSRSRMRPAAVGKTYLEGCVRHERARR